MQALSFQIRSRPSKTPGSNDNNPKVIITHPFHPLLGREFDLITKRSVWGEDRVFFHDCNGKLISVAASWTNWGVEDPFVAISAGRSLFRVEDLLSLRTTVEAAWKDRDRIIQEKTDGRV